MKRYRVSGSNAFARFGIKPHYINRSTIHRGGERL